MSWDDELETLLTEEVDRDKLLQGEPAVPMTLDEKLPGVLETELLADAQRRMRDDLLVHHETTCPCCGQIAGIRRRPIYRRIAKWLIWLVEEYEREPGWKRWNAPGSPAQEGGDIGKWVHWGMIESFKNNSGLWRPTLLGITFVHSLGTASMRVPDACFIFNKQVLSWSTKLLSLEEVLTKGYTREEAIAEGYMPDDERIDLMVG